MTDYGRFVDVLRMIRDDAEADTALLEGKPFSPRLVAEELGKIRGQIAALAVLLAVMIEEELM